MRPVEFEGSTEIKKPANMTDEECSSAWATAGVDINGDHYYMTAWQPNYEDLQALNAGKPIFVKTLGRVLPPMALFTLDENNKGNF